MPPVGGISPSLATLFGSILEFDPLKALVDRILAAIAMHVGAGDARDAMPDLVFDDLQGAASLTKVGRSRFAIDLDRPRN